jgi:hypothetical protein
LSQNGYRLLRLLNGHRRCDPKAVRGNEQELHPTGTSGAHTPGWANN